MDSISNKNEEFMLVESPIVLSGMHRSGTSLAASIVRSAGVDFGYRFSPPDVWNRNGYFEDLDFVDLHREMLRSQLQSDKGWTLKHPMDVSTEMVSRAMELKSKKTQTSRLWGWKDPRTVLFLDFWRGVFPNARFVFVYRAPWEVAESIIRRKSDLEIVSRPRLAFEFWTHYNRLIYGFIVQNPGLSILVHMNELQSSGDSVIQKINGKFNLDMSAPAPELFNPKWVHARSEPWKVRLTKAIAPDAVRIFSQLNEIAGIRDHERVFQTDQTEMPNSSVEDAMHFWMTSTIARRKME